MPAQQAALLGLEAALNRLLRLDPGAAAALSRFHGRAVGIEVLGLGLALFFIPDAGGRLQVLADIEGEPDSLIRGTPLDLARSALAGRKEDALFAGRVEIRGDTDLAQRFTGVLGALDIDWEEQLAQLTGDVVAHEAGRAARTAGQWTGRTGRIAAQDLREYLQEELRVLPTGYEVTEWLDEVDRLRDDVERAAARIARLEAALRGRDGNDA